MLSGPAAALHTAKRASGLDVSAVPAAWAAAREVKGAPYLVASLRGAELVIAGAGAGGLAELRPLLDDAVVSFVGLSFVADGRQRFAFCIWVGPSVGAVARGRVSLLKGAAAAAFEGTCVELNWASRDDTIDAAVLDALRKQGRHLGGIIELAT